jgi:hypothetical protein
LKALPQTVSLAIFSVSVAVGVSVSLLLAFLLALVAFVLVHLARPDALDAFRVRRGGARAAAAGVGAALVVLGVRALRESLRAAFPLAMGLGGLDWPPAADSPLPFVDLLESAVRLALLVGAGAALAVLVLRRSLTSRATRLVACLLLAGLFARWSARTGADLLLPLLGGLLVAAALFAALAVLLRDDPLAYALFAATILAVRGAELLGFGIRAWTLSGGLALAAAAAVFLWLLVPRRASAVSP